MDQKLPRGKTGHLDPIMGNDVKLPKKWFETKKSSEQYNNCYGIMLLRKFTHI